MAPSPPQKLLRQVAQLQTHLSEAEETLNAIRSGSIDALVVRTPRGEQLFTLKGADQTYRALVEAMSQGAVTIRNDIISYCNSRFAEMTSAPIENVFGSSIFDFVKSDAFRQLVNRLQSGKEMRGGVETLLRKADGSEVPVLLSGSRFYSENRV